MNIHNRRFQKKRKTKLRRARRRRGGGEGGVVEAFRRLGEEDDRSRSYWHRLQDIAQSKPLTIQPNQLYSNQNQNKNKRNHSRFGRHSQVEGERRVEPRGNWAGFNLQLLRKCNYANPTGTQQSREKRYIQPRCSGLLTSRKAKTTTVLSQPVTAALYAPIEL